MNGAASVETGAWLTRRKTVARARFDLLGIPKPTDEDWRQTDVRSVAAFAGTLAEKAAVSKDALDAHPLASLLPCRAVLVNGRFDESLSTLDAAPRGVHIRSLAAALAEAEPLEHDLGKAASAESAPFVALNTSLFLDGILVRAEANAAPDTPVHIVHVAAPGTAPAAIHPRTLVIAEAGARLTVVESFIGLGSGAYLTNAVTEIIAADGAEVAHVKIQVEGAAGVHVASVAGHQAKDSKIVSHNVSLGASVARNDIGSRLAGPGAECHLYGLYVTSGRQHVDNHTWLDHAMPHCPSWEMYKGLLAGDSRAVFNGRIVVREGAQKTDAKQSNKNLLLGEGALVYTRPQLEIYANDVKCTHGATIGRLDEESLFYLRTRGIGKDDAKRVLVRAFAGDLIDKIPVAEVRAFLSGALDGSEALA